MAVFGAFAGRDGRFFRVAILFAGFVLPIMIWVRISNQRRSPDTPMNTLRTAMLLAALTALFMAVGYLIGGGSGMVIAFLLSLIHI